MPPSPKPLVERTPIGLDLYEAHWKVVLSREGVLMGTTEWRIDGVAIASGRWALGAVGEEGSRPLLLAIASAWGSHFQRLTVVPVRVGFSLRLHAKCPGECGATARKVYLPRGADAFQCWQCSGLQYTSAAKHSHRVNQLARDPKALVDAMEIAVREGRSSVGLMRAMERRVPGVFTRR